MITKSPVWGPDSLMSHSDVLDLATGSLLFHYKVSKTAKIRKRYNQVPHLTQDTTWESNKNILNITNKSQEASPFSEGNHKDNEQTRSMRNTRHKNNNDPQKKYRLGTASKNILLLEGLNLLNPHSHLLAAI